MSGLAFQRLLFLQKAEVLAGQREQVREKLDVALPGTEIVFAGSAEEIPEAAFPVVVAPTLPWLPEALARVSDLQWVHFLSAGVEKIWDMPVDWSALTLTKSSGIHGPQMSEYVIGAMLYFAKQFNRFVPQSQEARWERAWLEELTGRSLMILGLGHIGSMVAQRARVFGMHTIGVQRTGRQSDAVDRVVVLDDIAEHLPEVDYLVVCLPLTTGTYHLVDRQVLGKLKPGSVLVDISRGGVVEEAALVTALNNGILKGAALDVFERQPLPPESPLWNDPRVLLTPHVSGTSPHYMERALDVFIANAKALGQGRTPVTPVDVSAGY